MKNLSWQASKLAVAVACVGLMAASARAEVKVTVSKMHICCKGCTMAIEKAVAKMPEVKCTVDQENHTTTLSADKAESVQKALDAIAKAGFDGAVDSKEVKIKAEKTPKGKVTRLEVYSMHNCCPACTKAIKGALAKVDGVKSDTCEAKKDTFVIEGDFSAKDALAALSKAGFHASLTKPKEKAKS